MEVSFPGWRQDTAPSGKMALLSRRCAMAKNIDVYADLPCFHAQQ